MPRTHTTVEGVEQFAPTADEIEEMIEEQQGFCLACGETQEMVEPDARGYTCDCCGAAKVFGAEELVLMGLVK